MANKTQIIIDKKITELVGIIGREKMDILADVVGKQQWAEYRKIYQHATDLGETPYPVQLDFELNASCNLRCQMCPRAAGTFTNHGRSTWFKFEKFKEIIDDGVPRGLKAINLSYINEPLLRDDLPMFVEYARRRGICDVYFPTNGMLINENNIQALITAGLTRIQISIDAVKPETYERIRPGGQLKQVLKNLDTLLKIRKKMDSTTPLVRVNFVRTAVNNDELNDFIVSWKDKVEMIGIQEMVKVKEGKLEHSGDLNNKTENNRKRAFKCSVPFHLMVITNEGIVLPCCALLAKDMPIGNIHDAGVQELWHSEPMRRMRQLHLDGRYDKNMICKQCVEDSVR